MERLVVNKSGHDRVLARLTLKGNYITERGKPDVFLDGDSFRAVADPGVRLPSGDGRRGGDFEMWFWISNTVLAASFTIEPNVLRGGNALGTITLQSPATSDVLINLQSNDVSIAQVPPTATIPASETKVSFNILVIAGGGTDAVATITANLPGTTISQTLTRQPPIILLGDNPSVLTPRSGPGGSSSKSQPAKSARRRKKGTA
jgi:hypothetical protein